MKKKIISIWLCLVMICSIMPTTTFASETISEIVMSTIIPPTQGSTPSYTVEANFAGYKAQDNTNTDFDKNGVRWYDLTTGTSMKEDDKYIVGHTYRVFIYVVPEAGYTFDVKSVTVNGHSAKLSNSKADSVEIYYDYLCEGTMSNIDLTRVAPTVGNSPDYSQVQTEGYESSGDVSPYSKGVKWYDETGKSHLVKGTTSAVFKCGHVYTVEMNITITSPALYFASEVSANVNTKKATVQRIDNKNIIVSYTFAALGHSYNSSWIVDTKATTTTDGSKSYHCVNCTDKKNITSIPKVSNISLSYVKKTYTGSVIAAPALTVKDSKGTVLKNNTDYTVGGLVGNKNVGLYKATITFKGNYTGTKNVYYAITPKAPKTVKINLSVASGGYDDVVFSWSKVTGASGYRVYYKKSTDKSFTLMGNTTKTSATKKNLADGAKYIFRVYPYYKASDGKIYYLEYKNASVYTLKKVSTPKATRKGSKVRVSWTNINGETGYQISRATTKKGTKIVATYKTTSGKYRDVSATKNKRFYYKVRAYKMVDGKPVYGPWSAVKVFKR